MTTLFEDEHILVCLKPGGIMSQKGEKGGKSVQDFYDYPVFTIHRLDKETAGIMVYAKTPQAAANLSQQIQNSQFHKRYFAVLQGIPQEKTAIFEDLLFRDRQRNKTFVVERQRGGVKRAKLQYETVETVDNLTLVDIELFTGRTHQIRVQFASRKLPLLGDGKYGGGKGELALFEYSLSFKHPITGKRLTFRQEPDKETYPWNLFGKEE